MSYSKLVEYVKLSPNCSKPRNQKVNAIVIHHVAGNATVEALGALFAKESRQASSNYGIGTDGRIACFVEEENRAWTSGSREIDNRAITFEVANCSGDPDWRVSDQALEATIALCVDICKRYGFKLNYTGDKSGNLHMHKWYQNTGCPGPYLESKFPYIAEEVNRRLSGGNETSSNQTVAKDDLYRVRKSWDDAKSQIGAFKILDYAKNACIEGYTVYDGNGNAVYSKEVSYTQKQFITDVQKALAARVSGVACEETLSKTVTVSAKINCTHAVVVPIQKRLYALGYTQVGKADGIAGPKFTEAVKAYQNSINAVRDGEITAGCKTWKRLLGLK